MGTPAAAAAAASTGSTTTGTVVTAAQTAPFSVSSLSISTGMFAALTNDTKFASLSLAKDNWPKWKQKILQVLGMSDLDDYILGTVPQPDVALDPLSYRNWTRNHSKTIAFLQMQVEDSELQFLEGTTEANTAWLALVTRHEKQGPHHASSSHSRSSFRLVFRRRLCCSNCTKNKSSRVFEISRVFRVITQIGIIALSQIGQSVSGQSRSQL
jgi:hypothetical protein